jgi:hypothetical protein
MTRLVNVVRHLDSNLGDRVCSPTLYFPWLVGAEKLDPHEGDFARFHSADSTPDVVIVGGGGQIANRVPEFDLNLQAVARSSAIKIAWGVGHNRHDDNLIDYPSYLDDFNLTGLRDWPSPYEWVPCASCLHPLLDRPRDTVHDAVVYEHWQIPLAIEGLPSMKNSERSLSSVLDFLASGEVVVTNTYHGCYWATLIGRRVVVAEPFSTKFLAVRHRPAVADRYSWRKAMAASRAYPEALTQCRNANHDFADRVRDMIPA